MLQLRDKRYNDVRLIFKEDGHKYTDTLGNEYLSTTTFLHDYSPRFDKSYWLRKKAKELGISEKKLAAQWDAIRDEACDRGSKTHNGLEDGVKLVSKFNDAIRYSQQYEDNSMSTIADLPQIDKHIKELDVKAFIDYTEGSILIFIMYLIIILRTVIKSMQKLVPFLLIIFFLALLMFCVYETINLL